MYSVTDMVRKRPNTVKEKGLEIHAALRYNSIVTGAGIRDCHLCRRIEAVTTGERAETVRWTVGTKRYPTKQGASEAKALAREATMRLGRARTPSCDNGNIQITNASKSKLNKIIWRGIEAVTTRRS